MGIARRSSTARPVGNQRLSVSEFTPFGVSTVGDPCILFSFPIRVLQFFALGNVK